MTGFWDQRAGIPEGWEAAAWGSPGSQLARFDALMSGFPIEDGDTLLDYGCGPADLLDYIWPEHVSPGLRPVQADPVHYTGIDASAAMLERASRDHPGHNFEQLDHPGKLDADFDWVVASGVWNVPPADTLTTFAQIAELWDHARKGLAVSLLRDRGEGDQLTAVRYRPEDLAKLAGEIVPRACGGWTLTTEHLPNDIALTLIR